MNLKQKIRAVVSKPLKSAAVRWSGFFVPVFPNDFNGFKTVPILFITLIFLFTTAGSATGSNPVPTMQKLVVGGDHDNPPYEFLENGQPTGFNVELMQAVAEIMSLAVEFRLGPWIEARRALEEGRIHALSGMYYSLDRSTLVDFTVPHTMVSSGIFVRKESPLRSYADIQGKEIIVQEGDIIHDSLRRNGLASQIVTVGEVPQVLKLLASGQHDCALMPSRLQGEHFLKTLGLDNIRVINTELPQLKYCFAVRKNDQELLARLGEGLQILKINGRYRDIYEKWFGVYEKKGFWQSGQNSLWVLLGVITAFSGAGLVWSRSLRTQVKRAGAELRESEEKFRVLADTIPAGIIVYQGENIVYVNSALVEATGYSEQEILGMKFWEMASDDIRETVKERGLARQRGDKPTVRYEYKWKTKNGTEKWALLTGASIEFRGQPAGIATLIDITERKQAEEALRASEEKFRVLAETSPSGICLYQGERIAYVNPATVRLFGYSEQECLQMRFWEWVHEDYQDLARERGLARQRGEDVPPVYEIRNLSKNGEEKWIHVSAGRIEYQGQPACIVTYFDISDRKRMEQELQQAHDELERRVEKRTAQLARTTEALIASEKEKSLILNITDAHVIYYNPDMKILWANRAAGDSVNLPPEELRNRRCWEVWHQRSEPCVDCPVIRAMRSRQPQEAELCSPDGRLWFLRTFPVIDETGKLLGVVEFTQDFTERKRTEEALRQANLVVENSPVVLFLWQAAEGWPVKMVSRNVVQFGYLPEEFTSGATPFASIIHPLDLARVKAEVRDYSASKEDTFCQEYRIFSRAGQVYWIHDHTTIERDVNGNILNYQGILIDITSRKLAEEQLMRQKLQLEELNCTLEERVREEVAKNREKDILLIQQNRQAAMGELLDHIAHQWKQPLTVISLLVQNLEGSYDKGELTSRLMGETIAKTVDLLEHMGQTIEVFREFYRPDKEKTVFSVKDAIDRALDFISPVLNCHAVAVEIEVDPGLMTIGYPREYTQVLLNILSNARDAFRERNTANPKITIRGFVEDNQVIVTMTDNAGGIPETIIPRIFDLYVTTKEAGGGTGIGLHMSKNIIEKNMQGSLTARNRDFGAEFRIAVTMPAKQLNHKELNLAETS
ncbi:MAG: PAS domain S-box protein [Syntrophotaleaceae bacterium]